MHPLIKKLDTSRYMLMHHYGGVSMCVYALNPADMLVLRLEKVCGIRLLIIYHK